MSTSAPTAIATPPASPAQPLATGPSPLDALVRPDGPRGEGCPKGGVGAAISARNATTHGLFARDVVLPALGEDPAAFDALLAQLCAQLPPRNLLERHYLEQIAAASWRLRRLHRWQAQVWEDDTLAEDQRLDKLDKTLRHETMLTRQIDRAVRLLHRDLSDLFTARARDEALRDYDVTEQDCRSDPYLAADIQRRVWDSCSAGADADLHGARLDTQVMPQADTAPTAPVLEADAPSDTKKCENELPPLSVAAIVQETLTQRIPPAGTAAPPLSAPSVPPITSTNVSVDDEEEYEDPDDYPFVDERYARLESDPPVRKICENETDGKNGADEEASEENDR